MISCTSFLELMNWLKDMILFLIAGVLCEADSQTKRVAVVRGQIYAIDIDRPYGKSTIKDTMWGCGLGRAFSRLRRVVGKTLVSLRQVIFCMFWVGHLFVIMGMLKKVRDSTLFTTNGKRSQK